MKTMFLAFAATVLVSVIAYYGLQEMGLSAAHDTVGADVRLDN
jgi:hypothetical protein